MFEEGDPEPDPEVEEGGDDDDDGLHIDEAVPSAKTAFDRIQERLCMYEENGFVHQRRPDGSCVKLGKIEFIHSSTLSIKGICSIEGHACAKASSSAASSSDVPPKRRRTHTECYMILHATNDTVRKYELCCEWLSKGVTMNREEHITEASDMKANAKVAKKMK